MDTQEACDLAITLMVKHGLMTETPSTWHFEFDAATTRLGLCRYKTRTITLSRRLTEVNARETVLDTILHEIAHAKAGYAAAHGYAWRQVARSIGAQPDRVCGDGVRQVAGAYQATCGCGLDHNMYRMPRNRKRCRRCKEPLDFKKVG